MLQKLFSGFSCTSNWENYLIIAGLVVYVFSFLFFSPSFYASIDEHGYLQNAVRLSEGKIGEPIAEYAGRALFNGDVYVSTRFIGRSLSIIPFLFLGLYGVMLSGMFIHIINFLILLLLFQKLGIKKVFALFYLFFPTFVWLSRTLYPGLLTLTFFLAAFYFYISSEKKLWLLSGFFSGLAVLTRNDAVYGVLAVSLVLFFRDRTKLLYYILGGLLPAILLFWLNSLFYGAPLSTGAGSALYLFTYYPIEKIFTFLIYAIILLAIPPLLLASPLLENKTGLKTELLAFSIAYLIMNSTFTDFFSFDLSLQSLVTSRLRYLVPLIGILFIPYLSFLSRAFESGFLKRNFKKISITAFAVFSLGIIVMSAVHSDFLSEKRADVREIIYSNTSVNSLIVGSSDDAIYFVKDFFPLRKYLNINVSADLPGNPENIDLIEKIKSSGHAYLLLISYSNVEEQSSARTDIVLSERREIFDFYSANKNSFDLVAENTGVRIWLYKYNGGPLQRVVQ